MADTKISALTTSTTPLAGTEVLPIVQSGVTKQVSVANLTTGRAISATQLSLTTGNLIVANGQGVDFSATSGTGTSEVLSDYEEGTWTPVWQSASGTLGAITYENRQGTYTKVGRMVTVQGGFYNSAFAAGTGSGDLRISGLPFTNSANVGPGSIGDVRLWTLNNPCAIQVNAISTVANLFYKITANGDINNIQVSDASNGGATNLVYFTLTYQV